MLYIFIIQKNKLDAMENEEENIWFFSLYADDH